MSCIELRRSHERGGSSITSDRCVQAQIGGNEKIASETVLAPNFSARISQWRKSAENSIDSTLRVHLKN